MHQHPIIINPWTMTLLLSGIPTSLWNSRRSRNEKAKKLGILHQIDNCCQIDIATQQLVKRCSADSSQKSQRGHNTFSILMFLYRRADLVGILSCLQRQAKMDRDLLLLHKHANLGRWRKNFSNKTASILKTMEDIKSLGFVLIKNI
ncbi:hypothetical protein HanPSC8_Chr01g0010531 [Helianthus annuus]|nr:hypothetical protein HanPSC8_Chr01g0010531 [Helianthus annuus]